MVEQHTAADFEPDIAQLDDAIRELRRRRNNEIDVEFRLWRFLRRELEISVDPIH